MKYRSLALTVLMGCLLATAVTGCSKPSAPAASAPAPRPVASATPTPTPPPAPDRSDTQPVAPTDAGAISTTLTVTPDSKKTVVPGIARPADYVIIAHAIKLLAAEQGVNTNRVRIVSRAQDSKGHWWILLSVIDPDPAVGTTSLVLTYDGKAWNDPVYGEVTNTDLPPDVRF